MAVISRIDLGENRMLSIHEDGSATVDHVTTSALEAPMAVRLPPEPLHELYMALKDHFEIEDME